MNKRKKKETLERLKDRKNSLSKKIVVGDEHDKDVCTTTFANGRLFKSVSLVHMYELTCNKPVKI